MRDRIKDLRVDNDLTQQAVGKILGITQEKYGYIERGIQEPDKALLIALSELYKTSVDYLLGKTDVKTPYPPSEKRR